METIQKMKVITQITTLELKTIPTEKEIYSTRNEFNPKIIDLESITS